MTKSVTVLALEAARAEVKRLVLAVKAEREAIRIERANAKEARAAAKVARVAAAAEKRAARIAKLEAKLAAMKNPVGVKAMKANRKPSKVTVTKGARA